MGEYRFYQWMRLEQNKERITQAVEGDGDFPDALLLYLSTALGVSSKWYEQADWLKVVELFYACLMKSPIIKLPITTPTGEKFKDDPWAYEGRTWHLYTHLLAKSYGWNLEYISQLRVGDALAKIQEILTDEQLDREFYYGLSEVAYPYNKQTKKSVFKPMQRPYWMREKIRDVPRFKIAKEMLPVGAIIMDNVLPDEYLPKEIVH